MTDYAKLYARLCGAIDEVLLYCRRMRSVGCMDTGILGE